MRVGETRIFEPEHRFRGFGKVVELGASGRSVTSNHPFTDGVKIAVQGGWFAGQTIGLPRSAVAGTVEDNAAFLDTHAAHLEHFRELGGDYRRLTGVIEAETAKLRTGLARHPSVWSFQRTWRYHPESTKVTFWVRLRGSKDVAAAIRTAVAEALELFTDAEVSLRRTVSRRNGYSLKLDLQHLPHAAQVGVVEQVAGALRAALLDERPDDGSADALSALID